MSYGLDPTEEYGGSTTVRLLENGSTRKTSAR